MSDLVEAVLRWLVLPPVDATKVGTLRARGRVLGVGLVLPTVDPAKVPFFRARDSG